MQENEFPRHLLKQLNLVKYREEQEQMKREQERNTCKVLYLLVYFIEKLHSFVNNG